MSRAFDYEAAQWGGEALQRGERSIAGFRLEEALARLPPRGALLEIGCGGGRFLRAVARARPELRCVGVDVSRSALESLRRAAPGVEARLAVAGEALPAAAGEFQAVWMLDVLEHLEDPDAMLAEAQRVLAPGGWLHLHVPCEADATSPWRWLPGRGAWKRRYAGHLQRFRRRELLARVESAGFEISRVRYSLHLVGALADVAVFAGLAATRAFTGEPRTTGDWVARGAEARSGGGGLFARAVAAVDALLWCEARLLSRLPSWSLHVSAQRSR